MSFTENQYILVRLPSQNFKFVQLVPDTTISLGKFGSFRASDIIGDPYGFTYSIGNDMELSIVDDPNKFDDDGSEEQTMTGYKIQADGHQTLSADQIEELKKSGVSGQEIIDQVAQGHAAFQLKTEFSKDKYLKRKKQKFLQQFTPAPITVNELLEYYQEKDAGRIMNLSLECLALVLSMANIQPGGHYLVVDETPGVVVAAMLERIGAEGSVTILHENEHPNLACFKFLPPHKGKLYTINLQELLYPAETPDVEPKAPEELKDLRSNVKSQYMRALARQKDRKQVIARSQTGFDGMIVVTSLQLMSLLEKTLRFMKGSAPIVFYHPYKEHLVNLTIAAKPQIEFLAPTIMETRVRKYQTIPGRIHPLMTSKNFGGYLLYGTRVLADPAAAAVGHQYQRKKKKLDVKSETEESKAEKTVDSAQAGSENQAEPADAASSAALESVDVSTVAPECLADTSME